MQHTHQNTVPSVQKERANESSIQSFEMDCGGLCGIIIRFDRIIFREQVLKNELFGKQSHNHYIIQQRIQ